MEKNIELEKDNCKKNINNKEGETKTMNVGGIIDEEQKINEYNELGIVINQQVILSQKVGILMAIDFLIVGFFITIASITCWYVLFVAAYFLIPLGINISILFPNFNVSKSELKNVKHSLKNLTQEIKKDPKSSKYFFHYAYFGLDDIDSCINKKMNTLAQIKMNSQILIRKYKYFEYSLASTAFFLPYFFRFCSNKHKKIKNSCLVKKES